MVWCVTDFDGRRAEEVLGWLSPHEFDRARRFRDERARWRYVITRAALRDLLASELGGAPQDPVIEADPQGKPVLIGPPYDLQFNVSHSRDLALIVFQRGNSVGIDVEVADAAVAPSLLRRVCTFTEFAALKDASDEERRQQFLRYWVRKEAVAKADGRGLRLDFATIDVSATGPVHVPGRTGRATIEVEDLAVGDTHVAALANAGPVTAPVWRRWSPHH